MAQGAEAATPPGGAPGRARWTVAAVCAAALAALAPALLPGADFAWDDTVLVRDNPLLASTSDLIPLLTGGFWQTADLDNDYYRPLVSLSYWLERQVFGTGALAHHWVNALLHVACIALVHRWLARRLRPGDAHLAAPWLAVALLVFAVHPSRAESVAWISGRTDPMALLLALLGFEAYRSAGALRVPLASLSLLAATLCKETAAMLLVPWLLDAWLLAEGPKSPRRPERGQWMVAGIVATGFALRLALVPGHERPLGSPASVLSAAGLYLRELLAPFPPSGVVAPLPFDAHGAPVYPPVWIAVGALAVLGFGSLIVAAARRSGPRPWLADALWFVVPLLPVSQLVLLRLAGHVAERFLYIPMLGACALLLRGGIQWSRLRPLSPRIVIALGVLLGLLYFPFTLAFARAYRSDPELWAYELALDPHRVEVLDQVLRQIPREDLETKRRVARDLFRVAAERNRPEATMKGALHLLEMQSRVLPTRDCLAPLATLDDLWREGEAHIGPPHDAVHIELPRGLAQSLLGAHEVFWAQRAQLLIRCGQGARALQWLEAAPSSGAVAAMRVRATALTMGYPAAQAALAEALAARPHDRHLRRAQEDLQQARALHERAERDAAHRQVLEARAAMQLDDLWSAQAALAAPEGIEADDATLLNARIELELRAHRAEGFAQALQDARRRRPDLADHWRSLEVHEAAAGAPPRFPQPPADAR